MDKPTFNTAKEREQWMRLYDNRPEKPRFSPPAKRRRKARRRANISVMELGEYIVPMNSTKAEKKAAQRAAKTTCHGVLRNANYGRAQII